MGFLKDLACHIRDNYSNLEDLVIVLPSIRAKRYLKKELVLAYERPIFSPQILTIDEWIKGFYPNIIDRTRGLIELYEIHNTIVPEVETFEDFLQWGTILLNDFNDIDLYLLDSKDVFKNLKSIKELEAWQLDKPLTERQTKFFDFWERLDIYYKSYLEKLNSKNYISSAKAYKKLSQTIELIIENSNFIFAGFNALSKSESEIISKLLKKKCAEFIIDADSYYLNDSIHEAGMFLRKSLKEIDANSPSFIKKSLESQTIQVQIYECPQITGQVKIASEKLAQMSNDELNNTALILADESLITSVLHNLPPNIDKANITLGLPLEFTPIKNWIKIVFSFQEHKLVFKTDAIYHHDLFSFMHHVFVLSCTSIADQEKLIELEKETISRNKIFQSNDNLDLPLQFKELLQLLTINWKNDWLLAINTIRKINKLLIDLISSSYEFELSSIIAFDNALIAFQNLTQEGLPTMTLKSFEALLNEHWKSAQLSFQGSHTEGLQIMGILESRLLNFKNLIILGFNEGSLPSNNPISSIIPIDLRLSLGLPTTRQKQGVFAHHFYRLLHECENLICTYYSSSESIRSSEKSRYLLQLEYELAVENKNITLEKYLYTLSVNNEIHGQKFIPKTEFTKQLIMDFFNKSISASAINKYLKCPLDFYYRYIAGFEESNEVEEIIEQHNFGTFIHKTLEQLYRPFAQFDNDGNKIDPSPPPLKSKDIDSMLVEFPIKLKDEFLAYFNGDNSLFEVGRNKLSFEMALLSIEKFLISEKSFINSLQSNLFIEYLEFYMESSFEINISSTKHDFHLKGVIDRIDRIGDKYRIIDYKTGACTHEDVTFEKSSRTSIKSAFTKSSHVLQLSFYNLMFEKKFGRMPDQTLIKSLISPHKNYVLNSPTVSLNEIHESSIVLVEELLAELLDEKQDIEHNPKSFYCKFCE